MGKGAMLQMHKRKYYTFIDKASSQYLIPWPLKWFQNLWRYKS